LWNLIDFWVWVGDLLVVGDEGTVDGDWSLNWWDVLEGWLWSSNWDDLGGVLNLLGLDLLGGN